ncbi:MAG TPA: FecR family protein [Puia sp.]|jgi:hypothetical protein
MADKHHLIVTILVKYALRQELSAEEQRLLREWRARSAAHNEVPDQLRDPQWRETHQQETEEAPSALMWENIRRHIRESKENELAPAHEHDRNIPWGWIAAASVVVLVFGFGWWRQEQRTELAGRPVEKAQFIASVSPAAHSGVEVWLADGQVVHPENLKPGETRTANGEILFTRTEDGIEYAPSTNEDNDKAATQYISIGRGVRQAFQVKFPDGTRIWLDSNTRIAFGRDFRTGPEPVLEGQAFFDVARHDPAHPLRVWTGRGESMTVLGTSFNVRSYAADARATVELYTGKLRVNRDKDSLLLTPSQMALMTADNGLQLQSMGVHGDTPLWMLPAGKSPYFEFQNTPLSLALNEVAGWYRKSVSNPEGVPGIPVTGKLAHSQTLENTLAALQRVQSGHAILRSNADTIFVTRGDAGP